MNSKEILPENQRLNVFTLPNSKIEIQINLLDKYNKALESAEKEIEDLKVQLGEGLTKEFFRKESVRLNKWNKERHDKALEFIKQDDFYVVFNALGEETISKCLKIASGYEE